MAHIIRNTRSLCPVCLKNLEANLTEQENHRIYLNKTCPKHGSFSALVWGGEMDFDAWVGEAETLTREAGGNDRKVGEIDRKVGENNRKAGENNRKAGEKCSGEEGCKIEAGIHCPENCGLCEAHETDTCCVLLEVTKRCNLRCRFCFADGGCEERDPSQEELREAIRDIVHQCKSPLLQFSGGEPTLREDLPELIGFAKEQGCHYCQVNTNGIRLAQDPVYVEALAKSGLDIVFLQFDGTEEPIYKNLRGTPLLEVKKQAIENCTRFGLGVTLVPTVVPGINVDNLGEMIRFAAERVPGVRGIHFQPVSYFGRYPEKSGMASIPSEEERFTLDQLMGAICDQTGIPISSFLPSRCDHPLCGFHSNFLVRGDGSLRPLTSFSNVEKRRSCATENREYVARHWRLPAAEPEPRHPEDEMDFDTFLFQLRHRNLTLSAMAFQDAMNLNIERLVRCSLHVYREGKVIPFCANYLSSMELFG